MLAKRGEVQDMNKKQYLHCDFIVDNSRFVFFSYDNFLLEFNLNDHKLQFSEFADTDICGKIAYRDSIERLIRVKEILIAFSISGEKIYFYNIETKCWKTIAIECNQYRYGNYIDILYNDKFVYAIPKYRPYILAIDIHKQYIVKVEASFLLQLSSQGTVVCMNRNALYFFESQSQRILIFYPDTGKYMETEIEYTLGSVASVQYISGGFLILTSDGYLIKWTEGSRHVELIVEPVEKFCKDCFLEFAVTEKNIWLLPMVGKSIYVYEIRDGRLKEYKDYPIEFSYWGSNGRYKFLRGHEYKNNIYFGMHSASHFLAINKKTGIAKWIEPIFPTEKDEYMYRIRHGLHPAENEGELSAEVFLKTIKNLDNQLLKAVKNSRIKENYYIGELIYEKVNGIC